MSTPKKQMGTKLDLSYHGFFDNLTQAKTIHTYSLVQGSYWLILWGVRWWCFLGMDVDVGLTGDGVADADGAGATKDW